MNTFHFQSVLETFSIWKYWSKSRTVVKYKVIMKIMMQHISKTKLMSMNIDFNTDTILPHHGLVIVQINTCEFAFVSEL